MTLKTMIAGSIVLVGGVLVGCAAGSSSSAEVISSNSEKESPSVTQAHSKNLNAMDHTSEDPVETNGPINFPIKMWLLNPGTPIYDNEGVVVSSTRLRPHILVYAIEGEKAVIELSNRRWIALSSLSNQDPQIMLEGPINSNGLPRISVEEMMETKPKGSGN